MKGVALAPAGLGGDGGRGGHHTVGAVLGEGEGTARSRCKAGQAPHKGGECTEGLGGAEVGEGESSQISQGEAGSQRRKGERAAQDAVPSGQERETESG